MQNFIFYNPVKIYFGKGQIAALAGVLPKNSRILLTYGYGSIKKNGVYDQVMQALAGYDVSEFGGIEPNPSYETLMQAVGIVRDKKIDFILAIGGGSVIDGTKFISAAAHFKGEPWDILTKQAEFNEVVPFGCVLTLPAAGSEMNCGAVISRKSSRDKLVFGSPKIFPRFAILDPAVTFSLSPRQTANGIVDAFVHVLEQYLTYPVNAPLQDRFAEGILLTLIEEAPKVWRKGDDLDARANIMWCATMALNDLIGMGVPQDWTTHRLGHEVTACFGLDHGQSLAVLLPNVLQVRRVQKHEKLLQYAERIFGIKQGDEDVRIDAAITKTREFFASLDMKLHLRDYAIDETAIPVLLEQLQRHSLTGLGERGDIDLNESEKIYRASL
ncbi:MAG: aldehyde reductase [Gammaproteobacteria bacterium GWE2_37_16]|nr:MAG: aldehyde reductase [Gammaproteobacteria bacterium GWE2_37_16]